MNSKDGLQAIGFVCATAIVIAMLVTDGTEAAVAAGGIAAACAGVGALVGTRARSKTP